MGRAKGILSEYIPEEKLRVEFTSGYIYVCVDGKPKPTYVMNQFQGKWTIDEKTLLSITDNKLSKSDFLEEMANM